MVQTQNKFLVFENLRKILTTFLNFNNVSNLYLQNFKRDKRMVFSEANGRC